MYVRGEHSHVGSPLSESVENSRACVTPRSCHFGQLSCVSPASLSTIIDQAGCECGVSVWDSRVNGASQAAEGNAWEDGHRGALSANRARTGVRDSAYLEMGAFSPARGMLDLQKTD